MDRFCCNFWRGGAWPKDQSIIFWWQSGFFHGFWIIFQDSLPLIGGLSSDILQCISASYEQILMKFFDGVGRSSRTSGLDFGGDPDCMSRVYIFIVPCG